MANPFSPKPVADIPVSRGAWVLCGFMFLATALSFLDRQVLSVLAPSVMTDLGLNNTDYSRIVSAFVFAYTIMFAAGGWLVDRLGHCPRTGHRRRRLVAGLCRTCSCRRGAEFWLGSLSPWTWRRCLFSGRHQGSRRMVSIGEAWNGHRSGHRWRGLRFRSGTAIDGLHGRELWMAGRVCDYRRDRSFLGSGLGLRRTICAYAHRAIREGDSRTQSHLARGFPTTCRVAYSSSPVLLRSGILFLHVLDSSVSVAGARLLARPDRKVLLDPVPGAGR